MLKVERKSGLVENEDIECQLYIQGMAYGFDVDMYM